MRTYVNKDAGNFHLDILCADLARDVHVASERPVFSRNLLKKQGLVTGKNIKEKSEALTVTAILQMKKTQLTFVCLVKKGHQNAEKC